MCTRTRTRTLRTAAPKLTVPVIAGSDRQTRSSTKRRAELEPECEAPVLEPRETRARAKRRKTEAETKLDKPFNIFTRLLYDQIDVFFVILSLLSPLDLFHLTQLSPSSPSSTSLSSPSSTFSYSTARYLRTTLSNDSSHWIWKQARKNGDFRFWGRALPPPPDYKKMKVGMGERGMGEIGERGERGDMGGFTEIAWAEFLFQGDICEVCNRRKDDVRVTCSAYTRVCSRCLKRRFSLIGPRYIKSYPRGSEMRKLRAYVPTTSVVLRDRGNGLASQSQW